MDSSHSQVEDSLWMRDISRKGSLDDHQLPTLLEAGAMSTLALDCRSQPPPHPCFPWELVGLWSNEKGSRSRGLKRVVKVRTSFVLSKKIFQGPKEGFSRGKYGSKVGDQEF